MEKIILKCRFITPAFVYGNGSEPEIRASSIKGLMRFWWRAAYKEFKNVIDMRNKESEIFGGKIIEGKEEFLKKSKVKIIAELGDIYTILGNGNLKQTCNHMKGYAYLFYSILYLNKDKKYFDEGTEFSVTLQFLDKNKEYVKEYLKAFNLLEIFGGIGTRSRRGGGNFVVEDIDNKSSLSMDNIKKYLYTECFKNEKPLINYCKNILEVKESSECRNYPNIISEGCKIYLCNLNMENSKIKNNFMDNLNFIGRTYKEIRNNYLKSESSSSKPVRGASPLIIKILRDGADCKILLIKLAGVFNSTEKNKKAYEGENDIVDLLFEKYDEMLKKGRIKICRLK